MLDILKWSHQFVCGVPSVVMILGLGVYLTVRTRLVQFRLLPKAFRTLIRHFAEKDDNGNTSPFRALCTALAATVGTGNLAGVAGAIAIGGPGSIFWMWICGLVGMATKYAEAVLAVRYQQLNADGTMSGGPMYVIMKGLGSNWRILAAVYCFFGVVASFGVGTGTQINAVVTSINSVTSILGYSLSGSMNLIIGITLGLVVTAMVSGGAKRIGQTAERLVPLAAAIYIALSLAVLMMRSCQIQQALTSIFTGAFSPCAVTGGIMGSLFTTIRIGVSRGVFTNEAGMGTAGIAHGGAKVDHPGEQGLMGIMEVFLDTIVICTLTALVILVSDVPIPYGFDEGMALTTRAFSSVYGNWVAVLLALEAVCFAFATILGWGMYGARCAEFLFGKNVWKYFGLFQGVTVVFSAVWNTEIVWMISEMINVLMSVPNIIALFLLTPEVLRLTKEYRPKRHNLSSRN